MSQGNQNIAPAPTNPPEFATTPETGREKVGNYAGKGAEYRRISHITKKLASLDCIVTNAGGFVGAGASEGFDSPVSLQAPVSLERLAKKGSTKIEPYLASHPVYVGVPIQFPGSKSIMGSTYNLLRSHRVLMPGGRHRWAPATRPKDIKNARPSNEREDFETIRHSQFETPIRHSRKNNQFHVGPKNGGGKRSIGWASLSGSSDRRPENTHTHSHSRQTANTSFPSIRKYPRRAQYKIAGGVTKKHFLFPAVLLPPRDPGRPPNNGILTDFVFQRSNRSMCLGGHTHPNTTGKR